MIKKVDDIEKDKQKIVEFTRSNELLDRILNGMYEGLMVIDSNYVIKDVNNCFLKQYKCSIKHVIGKKCYEITHQLGKPCFENEMDCPMKQVFKTGQPAKIEHVHINKRGKRLIEEISSFPLQDDNGNVEYAVELMHDISEQKKAVEKQRECEERFRTFFENGPEYCYMISPDETILDVNKAALEVLGYKKNELVGKPLKTIYPPDEIPKMKKLVKKWKKTGKIQNEEIKIIGKDGNERFVLLSADALMDKTGKIIYSLSVQRDITDRKKVEDALQYRLFFENLILSISTTFINLSPDKIDHGINNALQYIGEFVDADRAYVFQLKDDDSKMDNTHEWCGEGIESKIHRLQDLSRDDYHFINNDLKRSEVLNIPSVAKLPKDAKVEKKEFQKEGIKSLICVPLISGGTPIGFLGFDSVREEKTWSNEIIYMLKIVSEIIANGLERKRTEDVLRESEERYRNLVENISDVIYKVDKDGTINYVSPAVEGLIGYTSSELVGKPFRRFIYKEDLQRLMKNVQNIFKDKTSINDYRIITKTGENRWIRTSSKPVKKGRKTIGLQGVLSDITEQKNVENTLRENENKLSTIFAANPDITYLTDTNGKILDANPALLKLVGLPLKELRKKNVWDFFNGNDPQQLSDSIAKLKAGFKVKKLETQAIVAQGVVRDFEINAIPLKDDGKVNAFLNVARDITERKETEKALRESKDRYRTISELVSDFVYSIRVEPDGTQVSEWSTEKLIKIIGMNHNELLNKGGWENVIYPDDLPIVGKRTLALANGKSDVSEYRVLNKDGNVNWVRDYGYPVLDDEQKRVVRIIGAAQDITEAKRAEEELRKNKERFQDIVNLLPEAVFEIDLKGKITYANQRAFELSGYTQNDLESGLDTIEMFIPRDRKLVKKNIQRVFKGEKLGINEYMAKKKNGTTYPVLVHSAVIYHDGMPTGLRGIIMDITDRKRSEEALRESEEKFRSIAETSQDIIFITDLHQKVTYVSPAVEKILGYNPNLVIGKPLTNYISKLEIPKIEKIVSELKKEKGLEGFELKVANKAGATVYFEVNMNPIYKGGKLSGYQGIAREITERKRTEEEMKKRLMKFRLEEGEVYLVKEIAPTLALEAYKELMNVGYDGLIISRTPRRNFMNFIDKNIKFYWLSEKSGENTFPPDLKRLENMIEDLPNRKIVLLDRLDYLISKHGFKKVLKLFHHMKELAVIYNHIIIISIDPSTLNKQELRLFEKESEDIGSFNKSKLPENLIQVLKFIYQQNTSGIKPSLTEIGQELGISKPTIRKRIRILVSGGYAMEDLRGRNKMVELTTRGKNVFLE